MNVWINIKKMFWWLGYAWRSLFKAKKATKLTETKALEICAELWTWMAESRCTKEEDKAIWPGWRKYGKMNANCPCCEQAFQSSGDSSYIDCRDCLLLDVWGAPSSFGGNPCMCWGSPFLPFRLGDGTPRDSMEIVEGCRRKLNETNS